MNMQSVLAPSNTVEPRVVQSTVSLSGWGTLYTAGDASLLDRPSIAVVGSRRASHEGRALAAGIDETAHEAAMREGGRTIAVLGTSLDQAYPRHHAGLQDRIAMEHLVVSPFESGTPTAKWHFPRRNRLMAGLARAMVLVEAGATSGTRHQVEECLSLGKPIFISASLLKDGIEWLNTAYQRTGASGWRDPSELVDRVAQSLSVH
jgi:DNA processing protein